MSSPDWAARLVYLFELSAFIYLKNWLPRDIGIVRWNWKCFHTYEYCGISRAVKNSQFFLKKWKHFSCHEDSTNQMRNLADPMATLSYSCYCRTKRARPGNCHALTFAGNCNALGQQDWVSRESWGATFSLLARKPLCAAIPLIRITMSTASSWQLRLIRRDMQNIASTNGRAQSWALHFVAPAPFLEWHLHSARSWVFANRLLRTTLVLKQRPKQSEGHSCGPISWPTLSVNWDTRKCRASF